MGSMGYECCFASKNKGIFSFCVDMVIAKCYFGHLERYFSTSILPCICLQKRRGIAAPVLVVAGVAQYLCYVF